MKNWTATHLIFGFLITLTVVALLVITGALWRSLLVAGLVAYLLNPVVNWVQVRGGMRRPWAAAIVYVAFLLSLLGLISISGALLLDQIPRWSEELTAASTALLDWLKQPLNLAGFVIEPEFLYSYLERSASTALSGLSLSSDSLLGGLTDNLLWSLVILVSLYYFLRDGVLIKPTLIQLLPEAHHEEVDEVWTGLNEIWGIFLRVQLLIFAVLGVLIVISNVLVIWLYRQGWLPLSPIGLVLFLLVVYAAIQQVDNLWLRPQYMGQALKLHSGVVIVTLIASLIFTGVLGALISIPALASAKFLALHFYKRWMADQPPFAPQLELPSPTLPHNQPELPFTLPLKYQKDS